MYLHMYIFISYIGIHTRDVHVYRAFGSPGEALLGPTNVVLFGSIPNSLSKNVLVGLVLRDSAASSPNGSTISSQSCWRLGVAKGPTEFVVQP